MQVPDVGFPCLQGCLEVKGSLENPVEKEHCFLTQVSPFVAGVGWGGGISHHCEG